MTVSKVYRDLCNQLEAIHTSLQRHEEGVDEKGKRFLALEKEVFSHEKLEIDDSTRLQIEKLIRHLKSSPELESMLGALQAQFFYFLNRIETDIRSDSSKAKSVQKVELDRLEP